MSVSVTVAGTSYTIPLVGDVSWGPQVTAWIQAISAVTLQTSGGSFTLTNDLNFGASFGLIAKYFTSVTSNPASTGAFRLANNELISWRNAANSADIGLKFDNTNVFQLGAGLTVAGNISGTNFSGTSSGTNTGDLTLAAFGSTPSTNGASLSGQALTLQPADGTHGGGVSTAAQTFAGSKTFSAATLFSDGTASAPGLGFSSETNSGWFRNAAGDLCLSVLGTTVFEAVKIAANQYNFGLGGPASGSTGNAILATYTLNNGVAYQFGNASTGTSASTVFDITIGTASGKGTLIASYADTYTPNTYLNQLSLVQSDFNMLGLVLGSGYSAGKILFTFGTPSTAHEAMNLTSSALTLNGGVSLAVKGSSSGTITLQPQAAAGTYNWNWPTTAGSSGQVLTSQGGGSTAMTWSSVVTNPMTTLGDIILGGASGTPQRLAVGTNGQRLTSDSTATNGQSWGNPANYRNHLVNSAFDYWQVGISATVTATGGATPSNTYLYQPDQWYVNNKLGGGTVEGVITFSQVTGVTNGSIYGGKVQITTAPTGTGIQNGCELYQTLSNRASIPFYGQTASFSVLVKAFGNVNQVGVQFFYKTTEAKVDTAIGSEVLTTVNTSTFSACTINGQALGTSQTTSGVVGVRIRITGVSSGNTYDLNNGFVSEQAIMNLGPVAMPFCRQFEDPTGELASCLYFYEKSYDLGTAPGTNVGLDGAGGSRFRVTGLTSTTNTIGGGGGGEVSKRTSPSLTTYSTDGTSGKWRDRTNSTNVNSALISSGVNSFALEVGMSSAGTIALFEGQWVADARI